MRVYSWMMVVLMMVMVMVVMMTHRHQGSREYCNVGTRMRILNRVGEQNELVC